MWPYFLLTTSTSTVQSLNAGAAAWDYKMQTCNLPLDACMHKQQKIWSQHNISECMSGRKPKCTGSACLCVCLWHICVKQTLFGAPSLDWIWLIDYQLIDWYWLIDWLILIDWAIVRASVQLALPPWTGNTTHAASVLSLNQLAIQLVLF